MKTLFLIPLLLIALLLPSCSRQKSDANGAGRKIKFYQSPMHPWITSEKPGNCTICGMKLVPVYEGDAAKAADPRQITLQPGTAQVLNIAVTEARKAPLQRELRLAGEIEDDETKHHVISAFFEGRMDRVFINHVGEEVEKGKPLAEIYSPELLYVVREYQEAFRSGNRAAAENAGKRLIQYGLTAEQVSSNAQKNPEKYGVNILSPIAGTVITRPVYAGQYVKKGDLLFELGDFSVMWFHAKVYESDLPWIHSGEKARITTPAAPGKTFEGVVTFIDPNFDPATRSTNVRIEVPNPLVQTQSGARRELPHRAFGEAIVTVDLGEAVLIPRTAVLDTGRRQVVFVEKDGIYSRRDVKVGRRGEKDAEILEGIVPGENVVVSGNLMLDAESQLAIGGGTPEPSTPSVPVPAIAQKLQPLVEAEAGMSAALAADNLQGYNAQAKAAQAAWNMLAHDPQSASLDEAIRKAAGFSPVTDLEAARRQFLPFSDAMASLVLGLKKQGALESVSVFRCPMTDSAYEGAPASARWIQSSPPLKNPFFGAAMSDCGQEVKP